MAETGAHPPLTADVEPQATSVPPSRLTRLTRPLVTAGLVGGLTLALHVRDPHSSGSWGFCPWTVLTGYHCPGCGGLRAVNDLTHGDIAAAASSNLVFVALVPVLVLWWLHWTRRAWTGTPRQVLARRQATVLVAAFAVVAAVFTLARNLPAGSWLAP